MENNQSAILNTTSVHYWAINWYYTTVEIIISSFAVFGNGAVLYVICSQKALWHIKNMYIASLASADFLIGLLAGPISIIKTIGLPNELGPCLTTSGILLSLPICSIFQMTTVSIDRYVAVNHPFLYYRSISHKKAALGITGAWALGLLIGFVPAFGWYPKVVPLKRCYFTDVIEYNYLAFYSFTSIIVPSAIICIIYAIIFSRVHKQRMKITSHCIPHIDDGVCDIRSRLERKELKTACFFSIVIGCYLICWYPICVLNLLRAFCTTCGVPRPIILAAILFFHANAAINPLLFTMNSHEFRQALLNVAKSKCCTSSNLQSPNSSTTQTSKLSIV